jgi:hypothetical protein
MGSAIWGILDCVVLETWCLDRLSYSRLVHMVSMGGKRHGERKVKRSDKLFRVDS